MVTLDQCGAGRAFTRCVGPPERLSPWVEHFFVIRNGRERRSSEAWRIVPDMSPHLVASFVGDEVGVSLIGARTVFTDRPIGVRRLTVGARLRPGALPALTRSAAHEFTDAYADPVEVWGTRGARLRDQLLEAGPSPDASQVLADFLDDVLDPDAETDRRVRALRSVADRTVGAFRVRGLAGELETSERRLRDLSQAHLGMSPKRFARIHRLFGALERRLVTRIPWSRLAASAGYSDQSHLIREFGALLGESPERFWSRGVRAPADR